MGGERSSGFRAAGPETRHSAHGRFWPEVDRPFWVIESPQQALRNISDLIDLPSGVHPKREGRPVVADKTGDVESRKGRNDLLSFRKLDPKAPRTMRDYFELSREMGLPNRCPILQRCERRSRTIWLGRSGDGADMIPPPAPMAPVVPIIEDATRVGGNHNFFVDHLCPEVALFEPSDSFPVLSGFPMTSGQYDEFMSPPYQLLDTGHFSECAEYVASRQTAEPERQNDRVNEDVMVVIERIATRFPAVLAQLSSRRKGREALCMKDEYDVQYLFQAMLAVEFLDIRPEETGPSTGGGAMRADCLLKAQETIIEFKMTRNGYDAVQLRKELADDFVTYNAHPNCKRLFAFVYDPSRLIKNPRGVETDLSKPRQPISTVRTFIQQG
jgi:REase_DpnII-MboI